MRCLIRRRLLFTHRRFVSTIGSKSNDQIDVIVIEDDEEEMKYNLKKNDEEKYPSIKSPIRTSNVQPVQESVPQDPAALRKYYFDVLTELGMKIKIQGYKGVKWDMRAVLCPYCKPHKNNPTNLNTMSISTTLERYNCFRCGASGSIQSMIYDLGGKHMKSNPIANKAGAGTNQQGDTLLIGNFVNSASNVKINNIHQNEENDDVVEVVNDEDIKSIALTNNNKS